jgi:perosamine synthetase
VLSDNMLIPIGACLSLRDLLKHSASMTDLGEYTAEKSELIFTFTGSTALGLIAKSLSEKDKTHLLAPSYHCGHEIEPFFRRKYKISLYRVDRKGRIDIDHFDSLLEGKHQVALVTHYFGFPQNILKISELCRSKGIYLIEDCAHSFQSRINGHALGSWGDASVFSYRKSLPLPDGGALTIKDPDSDTQLIFPSTRPINIVIWRKILRLLLDRLMFKVQEGSPIYLKVLCAVKEIALCVKDWVKSNSSEERLGFYSPDDPSYNYSSEVLDWQMSKTSLRIINNLEFGSIFKARRNNYKYIETALRGTKCLRPMFDDLPGGICPLSFPVVASGEIPKVRGVMRKYPMIYQWWPGRYPKVDIEPFPDSQWLRDRCYILSIHQDLEKRHLDYLIDCGLKADKEIYLG